MPAARTGCVHDGCSLNSQRWTLNGLQSDGELPYLIKCNHHLLTPFYMVSVACRSSVVCSAGPITLASQGKLLPYHVRVLLERLVESCHRPVEIQMLALQGRSTIEARPCQRKAVGLEQDPFVIDSTATDVTHFVSLLEV